ncbi:MAG TPA: hypothetical protein VFG30_05850 [Polyangiales bacterium]|nr:hypothetical protein [Polyangiales bacterium]
MTRASCEKAWMVEAARVGQLAPVQAAQLREHLQSGCSACKLEKRYLDWLGTTLLEREPPCDEVAVRRLRQATLKRAHDEVYRKLAVHWRREWLVAGVVVPLIAAVAIWSGFGRTPDVVVTPLTAAAPVRRWSEHDREIVVLGDGVYELSVRRGMFDRQVVVRVPEGEIQDVGTVFGVSVQHGKTARVAVSHGAVVLHLRGVPEVRLNAGSAWEPAARLEVETVDVEVEGEATPVVENSAPSLSSPEKAKHRPEHSAKARPLDHERHARQHVSDASTVDLAGEDATYLRVLDLLRQQRAADARRLAELYLERFPRGFRRPELERIARPAESQ